jgi:hypothetical protein
MSDKTKRRWYQLSLTTLLGLTGAVAVTIKILANRSFSGPLVLLLFVFLVPFFVEICILALGYRASLPKQSFMKFSIRDIMLATLIVALALGWGLDHWRLASLVGERSPDIRNFKASVLEQFLRERGVTVECPRVGVLILTENGKTQELHYNW